MGRLTYLVAVLPIACATTAPADPPERMSTGADTTGGSGGPGSTGFPPADACEGTEDCEEEMFCVAPYDMGAAQRGEAACVSMCVGAAELNRWCIDDAACCEGLVCNEVDGFCVPVGLDGSSSTTSTTPDTDSDTDTDSDSDTGVSSSSSSSGSGSSSSSTSGSTGAG